ncbi:E3 ubiquitin-protein ligase TRIM56-like [Saccostrea echinata]|uniref:E3 ubiquitin-protein ligase TRIM56-like n=1 Tax=Saccostrea echinata TaxID=191078 RepID=UPI002A808CA7|nr:E3 ubiquitin-protein ligase TRIM56-like [Saccostrea echinata]
MESLSTTLADDFLTCTICCEIYTEPQTLPCLHSFCKKCILTFIQTCYSKGPYNCPICRETFSLEPKGLKKNFCLQNMIDLIKKQSDSSKTLCSFCMDDDHLAVSQCITCLDFLCEECSKTRHTFTTQNRNHKVMPLSEIRDGKYDREIQLAQMTRCPKHSHEIRYFCLQCNLSLCGDCALFDHKHHECKLISDVRKSKEGKISAILEPLKKNLQTLNDKRSTVEIRMKELEEKETLMQGEIDKVCIDAVNVIHEAQKNMTDELQKKVKPGRERLMQVHDKLTEMFKNINQSVNFSENILKRGNDVEVLLLLDEIYERLSKLSETYAAQEYQYQCPSVEIPYLHFKWKEPPMICFSSSKSFEKDVQMEESPKMTTNTSVPKCSSVQNSSSNLTEQKQNSKSLPNLSVREKRHRLFKLQMYKKVSLYEADDLRTPVFTSVVWTMDGRIAAIDKENSKIKVLTHCTEVHKVKSIKVPGAYVISSYRLGFACIASSRLFIFDQNFNELKKFEGISTLITQNPDSNSIGWMTKKKIFIKNNDKIDEKEILDDQGKKFSFSKPMYASLLPNKTCVVSDWEHDCVYLLDHVCKIFKRIDTYPGSIAFDNQNNIFISDYDHASLSIFDSKGIYQTCLKIDKWQTKPRSIAIFKDVLLIASSNQVNMYNLLS